MYSKIKVSDIPRHERKAVSAFELTPDWPAIRADMDRGIRAQGALQIVLTPEFKSEYGINHRRVVQRFLKKYIDENELPYSVESFQRNGDDYVVVQRAE